MTCSVLIIEEDTTGLNTLDVSFLLEAGFRAVSFSDTTAAFTELGKLMPDIVILGEVLLLDSFEICFRLRRLVDVPILMLSHIPRGEGWSRAVHSGADCYLVKPVGAAELAARMKALLRRCRWHLEKKGRLN